MSFIIFPCHLFKDKKILKNYKEIYVVEHPIYFTAYRYHKHKLMLHRASMRKYFDKLKHPHKKYVEVGDYKRGLFGSEVTLYDPADHTILKEFSGSEVLSSPGFICSNEDFAAYHEERDTLMNSVFYKWCRERFDVLPKVKSHDKENRKPFKSKPKYTFRGTSGSYISEARRYVERNFPDNPGDHDTFYLPIDTTGAQKLMKKFMKERFAKFGPYEDAVSKEVQLGYHSGLSALINIGLLTPREALDSALKRKGKVPIGSLEGYVRQLFWRDYMCYCYKYHATQLKKGNFFKNEGKLPASWYTADPGTGAPFVNFLVGKAWKYGYLHHIERLMFVGNYLLLAGTAPRDVFKWFMSFFVDAVSPWVMYGNVYGMSQFSCGRLIMTKPYLCSSNYVRKMSDFNKEEMGDLDELYHSFVKRNRSKLRKFGRNN